jgi:hypothetical protein
LYSAQQVAEHPADDAAFAGVVAVRPRPVGRQGGGSTGNGNDCSQTVPGPDNTAK